MNRFIEFLKKINNREIPEEWISNKVRINNEFNELLRTLSMSKPPFIYGVTSLVGHMDSNKLTAEQGIEFQKELINNHSLDMGFDYYTDWEVRCILYSKIQNYSQGGSGCSPEVYDSLINLFLDRELKLKIPKNSSYSCGDVIPGAFLAQAVIDYLEAQNKDIRNKDGISLINGNYISVGLALSTMPKQLYALEKFIDNSILYFRVSSADTDCLAEEIYESGFVRNAGVYIQKKLKKNKKIMQDSVSVRATLQTIEAIYHSVEDLIRCINGIYSRPSDNPLFYDENRIYTNSSFFSPILSIKLSAIIEVMLYSAWVVERRIHFLLSGYCKNVEINASSEENLLGLIQVPKLVTNLLEEGRLKLSRRVFASGSSTSYGIEDIWALTIPTVESVNYSTHLLLNIMSIEKLVIDYLDSYDYNIFKQGLKNIGDGESFYDVNKLVHIINILEKGNKEI